MAIPVRNHTNANNHEELYLRLEQLLRDLFLILRDIFAGNQANIPANYNFHRPPPPPPPPSSAQGSNQSSSTSTLRTVHSVNVSNANTGSRNVGSTSTKSTRNMSPKSCSTLAYWYSVGSELRDIADMFQHRRKYHEDSCPA